MYARLSRYYRSSVQTRGYCTVFRDGTSVFECKTLEYPWKGRRNPVSCISPGPGQRNALVYQLHPRAAEESESLSENHFVLKGVKGRDNVLLHAEPLYSGQVGGILVGREWVDINNEGRPGVTGAQETLSEIRSIITTPTPILVRWVDWLAREPKAPIAAPDREPAPSTIGILNLAE